MSLDPHPQAIAVRIKDACRMTSIGRSKFYELIAAGEIRIIKIGAMTLIPVESINELIEDRTQ
ncbi:hypothetical protein WSK_3458 [Novosphingobium sp. Rr 2-17]|uniref:helix-turn-helix domain-containing protein n=1 Tax=Novosphingobium sp. Rr 2-17 TaxID=555793 RepID=UPI0002699BFF|nr:helix-turn-helix domain-containing protein [Novosphingobium sp. Rr 2-17]EIZ77982.1 hypothetical protein WSK_3458 [Novosphingobium sp. Rr 2-17]